MYSKYIMLYSGDQGGIFYKSFTYKKTAKRNTYIQRIEHSSSEKAFSCFLSFDKTVRDRSHNIIRTTEKALRFTVVENARL